MTYRTVVEREFAIDRELMWQLWTDEGHASRWMRPSIVDYGPTLASIDARVGGRYRIEMTSNGESYATAGTYLAVDPIDHLSYTWAWEADGIESLVDVTFATTGSGTLVRIEHSQFDTEDAAERHAAGWRGCLESLDALYLPDATG